MTKWFPRVLLISGIILAIWAIVFPLHTSALQRSRCLAYANELRQGSLDGLLSADATKYADTFTASAKAMAVLTSTMLTIIVILIVAGIAGVWISKTRNNNDVSNA